MNIQPSNLSITILGNGGAINEGLPYNSFMINDSLLCELPPDIMPSLHRNKVRLSRIKRVFISHLHGDHVFGLPFFILSSFFESEKIRENRSITLIGPNGLRSLARELLILAFRKNHPCVEWMDRCVQFMEADDSGTPVLMEGYKTTLFRLDHMMETYGFMLSHSAATRVDFAYVADTLWCDAVRSVIEKVPKLVLIDLNGDADDLKPVHLSKKELVEKGLPITGNCSIFLGTHLKRMFQSDDPHIVCAESGLTAVVPPGETQLLVIKPPVLDAPVIPSAGSFKEKNDN